MPSSPSSKVEPKKSRFGRRTGGATPAGGATTAGGDDSRGSQVRQVFETTRQNDPAVIAWMAGAFALVFLIMLLIGFLIGHPIYLGFIGLFLGILAALFVFSRRANTAIYRSIQDQPGASAAVMSSLGRGWRVDEQPVAVDAGRSRQVKDMSSAAMVFRAIGKPGVVLVAEGPKGSATRLLADEQKKCVRVLGPEVPVHTYRVGRDDEATPVAQLTKSMQKLPKQLTDEESGQVAKRLRALATVNRQGIPGGVDPNKVRVNRAGMRGR